MMPARAFLFNVLFRAGGTGDVFQRTTRVSTSNSILKAGLPKTSVWPYYSLERRGFFANADGGGIGHVHRRYRISDVFYP